MNFNQLKTFIEVAQQGSLTRAAHKLFLTQPSVSEQLRRVETEIGCKLVDINKGKFVLTKKGKRFLRFAEYVNQESKNLFADLSRIDEEPGGNLNLLATPNIGEYILPSILNEFKYNYPSIDVNVTMTPAINVIDEIDKGRDTLGFIGKPNKTGIEFIKIGEAEQVFIAYPGHPLVLKEEVTLSDIIGEPLILRTSVNADYLINLGLDLETYKPKIVMGTSTGILTAVEAKLGIGLISSLAISNSVAVGRVRVINVKNFRGKHDSFCIFKRENLVSKLTQDFLSFIENYSTKHGYAHRKSKILI